MIRIAALLCAWLALATASASGAPAESPLDRRVSLHVRGVALREALDRVATLARIRISYSGDVVPLERRVSVARDSATVGEVLHDLLRGVGVTPTIMSGDHVVLAPTPTPDSGRAATAMLDGVVVTGSGVETPERARAIALDVVPGRASERRDESMLSTILDASVPGIWLFEQSPASMSTRYGSIRGASSFGVSYPKVYVDGIEVANPLLFTQVDAGHVARVEVIRGPQGAALYGADAISGVVNIVSGHEAPAGARGSVRSRMGWVGSDYAAATPLQEHAVAYRAGDNLGSLGVSASVATSGRFIPNAYSREGRVAGDARFLGPTSMLSLVGRFHGKRTGVPVNPLLPRVRRNALTTDATSQSLSLYALGGTWRHTRGDGLTLGVTAGIDGYDLGNVALEPKPVPSSADSALRAATGGADRVTLRGNAVRQVGDPERLGGTLTLVVEQGMLRDRSAPSAVDVSNGVLAGDAGDISPWSRNFGVAGQAHVGLGQVLYLTAGNRFEHIVTSGTAAGWEALPMLGAAAVRDIGALTAKVRTSYGRGVRAAAVAPIADSDGVRRSQRLAPEQQTGIDGGVDLYLQGIGSLHVTRFDQLASGLVQMVMYESASGGPGIAADAIQYVRQNVGEISNRGWEGKATVRAGAIDLVGTITSVDSRVRTVAAGYLGDLRPGDRMLGVPAHTGAVTAGWTRRRWSTSWSAVRATNWIDYDRLAIAKLFERGLMAGNLTGAVLRDFWVRYPGTTRVRGTFHVELPRALTLTLSGENLGGQQRGEPDNTTILPGRTITAALRANF